MIDFVAVTSFTVIIPLTVGLITYRHLPPAARYIFWLIVGWFVAEVLSYVSRMNGNSNWGIYLILSFFEIVLVTRFFKMIIQESEVRVKISWLTWIGLLLVVGEFLISDTTDNTITILFECLLFFCLGLYFLYENVLLKRTSEYTLITVCLMTFFLASSVYFTLWRFIKTDKQFFITFGHVHGLLLVMFYIVFAFSLWRLQSR